MKPVDYFSRDVGAFWTTTFQFDLKLFDQFLLRRVAQQPLNAVVLCDEKNLSADLRGLTDVDRFVAANANRRYLLRGVRLASGGRFHPKTYLFAGRRLSLLVGSGNLTRSGLDRGREVFKQFRGDNPEDATVILSWLAWIGDLVTARDDPILRERYAALRDTVHASLVAQSPGPNVFLSNGAQSLMEQLDASVNKPVTELHVTAPYFDRGADALRELVTRLAPEQELHVYVGARTNVDGPSLRAVLEAVPCRALLHRFEPDQFVHAKLIGIISGDRGLLAIGSANLSHAALHRTSTEPGSRGNCEAVVLCQASREEITAAFTPPDTTIPVVDPATLQEFDYDGTEEIAASQPVRLLSAELDPERHVVVRADPAPLESVLLAWDDQQPPIPLDERGRTIEPLPEDAGTLIIWLVDPNGTARSNAVVLDDPDALKAVMGDKPSGSSAPPELRGEGEGSELVTLLGWAHRRFVFDIDDTSAGKRARNAQEHAPDADDAAFWERYTREELKYDDRSTTYRPFGDGTALTPTDVLLREIQAMLQAAPKNRVLRIVRKDSGGEAGTGRPGHPWSFDARQQLRARNLLQRWARALADPRHAWLGRDALATNYTALIELLAVIALGQALPEDRISELLGETLGSLLGSEKRVGVIDRVDADIRESAIAAISEDTRQLAAALAYAALSPKRDWQSFIYQWQPFLIRGLELDLFTSGPFAADLASEISGSRVAPADVGQLLGERAAYVDESMWGTRLASELGLARVAIVRNAGFKNVSLVVAVDGVTDPMHDHRIISIARRALGFKEVDDVLVDAAGRRFLFRLGSPMLARFGNETRTSTAAIDAERLKAVDEQGGNLGDLLGVAAA